MLQRGVATGSGLYVFHNGMFVTKGCGHWEWFIYVYHYGMFVAKGCDHVCHHGEGGMFVIEGCGHWECFIYVFQHGEGRYVRYRGVWPAT